MNSINDKLSQITPGDNLKIQSTTRVVDFTEDIKQLALEYSNAKDYYTNLPPNFASAFILTIVGMTVFGGLMIALAAGAPHAVLSGLGITLLVNASILVAHIPGAALLHYLATKNLIKSEIFWSKSFSIYVKTVSQNLSESLVRTSPKNILEKCYSLFVKDRKIIPIYFICNFRRIHPTVEYIRMSDKKWSKELSLSTS